MDTVTVSPKFQVVIPKAVREELRIKPGQRVQAIAYDGRVELILVGDVRELRGSLTGMDDSDPREDGERE
jgi:AbrB family looped-hinge helix DNA binding protein